MPCSSGPCGKEFLGATDGTCHGCSRGGGVPSSSLKRLWKITMFKRLSIINSYKLAISHGYVESPMSISNED